MPEIEILPASENQQEGRRLEAEHVATPRPERSADRSRALQIVNDLGLVPQDAAGGHDRLGARPRQVQQKKIELALRCPFADAQNDADRASAKARLIKLQQEQAEMKQRAAEARAAAERAERKKGVKISKECLDNPLAKGCS